MRNDRQDNKLFIWVERWGLSIAVVGATIAALAGVANTYFNIKQVPINEKFLIIDQVLAQVNKDHEQIKNARFVTQEELNAVVDRLDAISRRQDQIIGILLNK